MSTMRKIVIAIMIALADIPHGQADETATPAAAPSKTQPSTLPRGLINVPGKIGGVLGPVIGVMMSANPLIQVVNLDTATPEAEIMLKSIPEMKVSDPKVVKTPPWLSASLEEKDAGKWLLRLKYDPSKTMDNWLGEVVISSNPGKKSHVIACEADSAVSVERQIPVGYFRMHPVFMSFKFLFRFDISELKQPVVLATVHLFSEHTVPLKILAAEDSPWDELTVVASNAPTMGAEVAAFSAISKNRVNNKNYFGAWNQANVTTAVEQRRSEKKRVGFYLENMNDVNQIVGPKEHAVGGPVLFVVVDDPASSGVETRVFVVWRGKLLINED